LSAARLPTANRNGHPGADSRQLVYEQRRRGLATAYAALPVLLVDDFEKLALHLELPLRLGALQLVATIRRRRTKILEEQPQEAST